MIRKFTLRYFIIVLLTFFIHFPVFSQIPSSQPTLTEIEKKGIIGRELIFHRKYDEALAYFKKLESEYPGSPLGTFGQMAIWQSRMFENYDFQFDREYMEVSDRNRAIVSQVLDQPNSSSWDLFLAGASSGIRSFYLMRKDAAFKALGESNKSEKALKKALEKEPGFKDIYLGLGMYDYWRSVFTNRLKFLPFFSDKRPEGLQEIEIALKEGRVVGALAGVSLAFCYYEQRNYTKAIPYLLEIVKNYPENVIAKNLLGDFYLMKGNFNEAHPIFDEILKNNPEVYVAKFFKATAYLRQNQWVLARQGYEDFLKSNPSPAWTSYALTDLGRIDLKEGKTEAAFEHFKKASRVYPDNPTPLKELNKLREKRW
ncbi:MAG: tetratricopeptide repeat protein [Deltaproteobacteria bacterium]|nr:tetratricopeptide repeat protein [Deltaproteobacteria bacterium]